MSATAESTAFISSVPSLDASKLHTNRCIRLQAVLEHEGFQQVRFLQTHPPYIYTFRASKNSTDYFIKTAPTKNSFAVLQLRSEWNVLEELAQHHVKGVARAARWESFQDAVAILYLDRAGNQKTLREIYCPKDSFPNTFESTMDWTLLMRRIQFVCTTLKGAHALGIRHGNIRPENIASTISNADDGSLDVMLGSWMFSSRLAVEAPMQNSAILEWSLAYVAPECTGRMNRSIDLRADFYSLGILLYEIIANILPFEGSSALQVMHQHISLTATPLSNLVTIPAPIELLITKLLSKNAEDRYQSAKGLLHDIERIIDHLEHPLTYPASAIEIGRDDLASKFIVSQDFVGRATEVKKLMDVYHGLSLDSRTRVVSISGYSGIGKSRLVREVLWNITKDGVFFAEFKFDQFNSVAPFAMMSSLIKDLLAQIFIEPPHLLNIWRLHIQEGLGSEAMSVCDLCPDVIVLLTPKYLEQLPPLVPLGPMASEERLKSGLRRLLQSFASPEKQLVLFLDDIQWAPPADLQLLVSVQQQTDLFILCAYRDNEVTVNHIVSTMFLSNVKLDLDLSVEALTRNDVIRLVAATLYRPVSSVQETSVECDGDLRTLAEAIYLKTLGNVFFITQILTTLYNNKLLDFDFAHGYWTWEANAINKIETTDDVIELVIRQITSLSPACQSILKMVSCLGNSAFRLDILEIICLKPRHELSRELFGAMTAGLVLALSESYKAAMVLSTTNKWLKRSSSAPAIADAGISESNALHELDKSFGNDVNVGYRFLHDKVQQAVYASIEEKDRPSLHLQIGLRLLDAYGDLAKDFVLFDICSQINAASALVDPSMYIRIFKLNLRAASTAFRNTASESALTTLSQADCYIPENLWSLYRALAEEYYELKEAIYASLNRYGEAVETSNIILAHSHNAILRSRMFSQKIKHLMSMGAMTETLEVASTCLARVEIDFGKYLNGTATPMEASEAFQALQKEIPSKPEEIRALADLPLMEDEHMLVATDMLTRIISPLFFIQPTLIPLFVLTGIKFSIDRGVASFSCFFMSFFGFLMCEVEHPGCDYVAADAWNETSIKLLDRLMAKSPRFVEHAGATLTLSGLIDFFTRDARVEGRQHLNLAISLSQRCFDPEYVAYALGNQVTSRMFSGERLVIFMNELDKHVDLVHSYKREFGDLFFLPTLQIAHALLYSESRERALEFDGPYLPDIHSSINTMEAGQMRLHLQYYWTSRLLLCIVFQAHTEALEAIHQGRKHLIVAKGLPVKYMFESMAFIALVDQNRRPEGMTSDLAEYFSLLCQCITGRARQNSTKFGAWQNLMEAELNNDIASIDVVLDSYEKAIEATVRQDDPMLEAIFNERCAKFLIKAGMGRKIASGHARAAVEAFSTWGCQAAATFLVESYELRGSPTSNRDIPLQTSTSNRDSETLVQVPSLEVLADSKKISSTLYETSVLESDGAVDVSARSDPGSHHDPVTVPPSTVPFSWQDDHGAVVDLNVVLESSLLLTKTLRTPDIVRQLLGLLMQVAGAQDGALVTNFHPEEELFVAAVAAADKVDIFQNLSLDAADDIVPTDLIRLVVNTKRCIIDENRHLRKRLWRASGQGRSSSAKSFLALPVLSSGKVLAVAYLCNNEVPKLFTRKKVELLTILAAQAAAALEKSKIYHELHVANEELKKSKDLLERQKGELEEVVKVRTAQLRTQNDTLVGEIQQRQVMEKQLVLAKDTAENATAMKSRFLAMMSHEIRTPFNSVIGFSTLLLDTNLDEDQQDMAQSIVDSSTDLVAIINDILDFSKIENDKMNLDPIWFDMRTLIESTLEIVSRPAGDKEIALAYFEASQSAAHWIYADNARMRQCVLNLLSNAVKFTPKHGTVTVETRLETLESSQPGNGKKHMLYVAVKDTGIGIAQADHQKLFQFFSQVDDSVTRRFGGTGLGLAISHKICQLFGGDLKCESQEGKGSTFTASFQVEVDRELHPVEHFQSMALQNKTCLILEKTSVLASVLEQHMEYFGVKTIKRSTMESISVTTDRCDFTVIGDSFSQPETIIALRNHGISVDRLPIVVLMPFGATLPRQPTKKDLSSIDAVASYPVRRVRLFRSLQSLFPSESGVHAYAKPNRSNLKTITTPGESFPRRDITILLVEDNLINVKVATQLLKRSGYIPKFAYDGMQALSVCSNEHFDLILMDLNMPKMGGIEATREIRITQCGKKKPYICAMTANAMSGDKERCLEAGMDDYITKPVMLPHLVAVLDKVRDMVTGTIEGHANIENVDHTKQKNFNEMNAEIAARRSSVGSQIEQPD